MTAKADIIAGMHRPPDTSAAGGTPAAPSVPPLARGLQLTSLACLGLLVILCLGWELWWAPLRPGGSWLALKAAPLMLPLAGLLTGRRYTYQWSSMFILLYFMEGVVRATSDAGPSRWLAVAEALLATTFFVAVVAYARLTRAPRTTVRQ